VAALVAVQVVGLNLSAWHERQRLDAKQQSLRQTLQQTFPGVTLVIDAPAQMRREVEQLQHGSGVLSQGDLETMLAALGDATPGQGPGSIDYATRSGRFGAWPGGPAPLASVQPALQGRGWRVSAEGEQLILQPQE
jgi:general secretion pathway protein L